MRPPAVLGSLYSDASRDFQHGIFPIARCVRAEKHDLCAVVATCVGEEKRSPCEGGRTDEADVDPRVMPDFAVIHVVGRDPGNPKSRAPCERLVQMAEVWGPGVCGTLTTFQKDNMVLVRYWGKGGTAALGGEKEGTGQKGTEAASSGDRAPGMAEAPAYRYRIRRLTPRECWRLMGFFDADFEKARAVCSDTQLYRQAGNSIVRQVLAAVLSQLRIRGVRPWNEMVDRERRGL